MRGIPTDARIAAGHLEDLLAVWEQRAPDDRHRHYRETVREAKRLCDVIRDEFTKLLDELEEEEHDYIKEVAKVEDQGIDAPQ